MIRITVQGPPLKPIANELAALPEKLLTACIPALRKSLDEIRQQSRNAYLSGPRPVKLGVITGNLKRSLQSTVQRGGSSITGSVFSDTPYSMYHEMGFHGRRRVVRSVRGRLRLAKSGVVNYPGRPFLWPSVVDKIPSVTNNLVEALRNA